MFRFYKKKYFKLGLFFLLLIFLIISYFLFWSKGKIDNNDAVDSASIASTVKARTDNYKLLIDKLNIKVPIILNVDGANQEKYFTALQSGVAQMRGTALPGEGNTVIFGHSNFYENDPGKYKYIFSTLDQLSVGDKIEIVDKTHKLIYKVRFIKIISPQSVGVVAPTKNKQLTLLTCWPPGSIDNRLAIIADLE
jgi:sortase A